MREPLTYFPAYLGLFASLVLALACNAFLDIRYGDFGIQVLLGAAVFGWTLWVGWRQQGETTEAGRAQQRTVLMVGLAFFVALFLPMWGLPRAVVYLVAVLQAAMNCTLTGRRELRFGLLVSAVMVMFAVSHYRADWTMLFYLLPYVVAVVFALVAEQIDRRAADLRALGLGNRMAGAQGVAIAAATAVILSLAGLLYWATPQVSKTTLLWKFGQPGNVVKIGAAEAGGGGADGQPDAMIGLQADGGSGDLAVPGGWPSPDEMRAAAARDGMPHWQGAAILHLADASEWTRIRLVPIRLGFDKLGRSLKRWLAAHRHDLARAVVAAVALAIALALAALWREARMAKWLRTRCEFLWLVVLERSARGSAGICQYYAAMESVLALHGLGRARTDNAQEYLCAVRRERPQVSAGVAEMTLLFEAARYGGRPVADRDTGRMRTLYRQVFMALP